MVFVQDCSSLGIHQSLAYIIRFQVFRPFSDHFHKSELKMKHFNLPDIKENISLHIIGQIVFLHACFRKAICSYLEAVYLNDLYLLIHSRIYLSMNFFSIKISLKSPVGT